MQDLVFIDLETTGTRTRFHEAWEIGCVDYEGSWEFQSFVRPIGLADAEIAALRIGDYARRQQAFAPEPSAVVRQLVSRLDGKRLASCNIAFDIAFLTKLFEDGDYPPVWHYSPIDVKSFCYGADPRTLGMKTDELLAHWQIDVKSAGRHTALEDAKLASRLFNAARTTSVGEQAG